MKLALSIALILAAGTAQAGSYAPETSQKPEARFIAVPVPTSPHSDFWRTLCREGAVFYRGAGFVLKMPRDRYPECDQIARRGEDRATPQQPRQTGARPEPECSRECPRPKSERPRHEREHGRENRREREQKREPREEQRGRK